MAGAPEVSAEQERSTRKRGRPKETEATVPIARAVVRPEVVVYSAAQKVRAAPVERDGE